MKILCRKPKTAGQNAGLTPEPMMMPLSSCSRWLDLALQDQQRNLRMYKTFLDKK